MRHILYLEEEAMHRDALRKIQRMNPDKFNLTMFEDSWDLPTRIPALKPPPALILVDVLVRPLAAAEVIGTVRQIPTCEATPLVAVVDNASSDEIQTLKHAGFAGIFVKPFDPAVMPSIIDRVIAGEAVWQV